MAESILILPTGTPLPAETKKLMKSKGLMVLYMDDPSKAITLHMAPIVNADVVTRCALQTVKANPYDAPKHFGTLLIAELVKQSAAVVEGGA